MAVGPHPLATRRAALRRVAKGEQKAEVCRQLGLDPKTLRKWIKEASEGKLPGTHNREVSVPVDEAPGALAMPTGKSLAETLAITLPVGSPQDLVRNNVAQKIARALEGAPIPQPTKISEFRQLIGILYDTLGITGKGAGGKQAPSGFSGNLNVRMEVVSRPPRSAVQSVDAEVVEDDEAID
jgi:transposase-like protein